jgi:hypothetical protein
VRPFIPELLAAFDRATAEAHVAGVGQIQRTARIKALEERVDELVNAYDAHVGCRPGAPPVLRSDVEEAIAALERELVAEVRRVAAAERKVVDQGDAFDALFGGVS